LSEKEIFCKIGKIYKFADKRIFHNSYSKGVYVQRTRLQRKGKIEQSLIQYLIFSSNKSLNYIVLFLPLLNLVMTLKKCFKILIFKYLNIFNN